MFQKLGNVTKDSKLTIGTKVRGLNCCVKSILLYCYDRVLDNITSYGANTGSNGNVVLQTNVENSVKKIGIKQRGYKEDGIEK